MTNESTSPFPPELLAKREAMKELFKKKVNALRNRLLGMATFDPAWYKAVEALEFGLKHHKGYRKDKITPSYMHQIEIVQYLMTLPNLLYPVRTVIAGLLHDTPEDRNVSHEEIRDKFGIESMVDVEEMTKEYRGEKKDMEVYFGVMAQSPVSSIGKGGDRIHNLFSMQGVFTFEKQVIYVEETETYFFSMLKEARRRFPQQQLAYENIKFVLQSQLRVFRGAHEKGIAA